MKKMLFAVGVALTVCSCNVDDDPVQNTDQTEGSVTADFKLTNPDALILEGSYVSLINNSQNGQSYLWDLGDGTTSTEVSPHHLFPKCGTYNVKLTVTDADGKQSTVENALDIFCTVPVHHANPMVYGKN